MGRSWAIQLTLEAVSAGEGASKTKMKLPPPVSARRGRLYNSWWYAALCQAMRQE